MSKKGGTPESEIIKAANRIRKYPEHLRNARTNTAFMNFLNEIGIKAATSESSDFWEKVRNKIESEKKQTRPVTEYQKFVRTSTFKWPTSRQMAESRAEVTRDKDNKPIYYKSTGLPKYRDTETGRFISVKSILKGRM